MVFILILVLIGIRIGCERDGTRVPLFPGPRKVMKLHPAVRGIVALALVQQATEGGVPRASDSGH